jgi:hypothetical protein
MAQIPTSEPWNMTCVNDGCELAGIIVPVYNAVVIECGGCNVVYEKPEE